jgi:hypothetical protein
VPEKRFGPALVAQELEKGNGVHIDAKTLRRWMLAEGLWSRQRKRAAYRQRRERREPFGELVQLEGSFHDWLEGGSPEGCLMVMVDDATGTVLCRLGEQETIWAAVGVPRACWIERYGAPWRCARTGRMSTSGSPAKRRYRRERRCLRSWDARASSWE